MGLAIHFALLFLYTAQQKLLTIKHLEVMTMRIATAMGNEIGELPMGFQHLPTGEILIGDKKIGVVSNGRA